MKIKHRLQFHLPILRVLLISEAATGGVEKFHKIHRKTPVSESLF